MTRQPLPRLAGLAAQRVRQTPAALTALLTVLIGVLLVLLAVPASLGSFTTKVTNSTNTAASTVFGTCRGQATTDSAYFFYRLDESAGTTATDSSGNARPGTYQSSGVTYRSTTGPCTNDNQSKVITLDGAAGYLTGPQISGAGPTTFSEEIWFKTTTTSGGKLIGFGNAKTGASGSYDRHIYMNNDGKLTFGIYDGSVRTIQTTSAYNDGTWHQAIATVATSGTYKGMRLYVDGALAASTTTYSTSEGGSNYYIRIGYDSLSGWTNVPSSLYFKGSLADVALYNGTALTPDQVASHYTAGK